MGLTYVREVDREGVPNDLPFKKNEWKQYELDKLKECFDQGLSDEEIADELKTTAPKWQKTYRTRLGIREKRLEMNLSRESMILRYSREKRCKANQLYAQSKTLGKIAQIVGISRTNVAQYIDNPNRRRYFTIEDMRKIAQERGGKCLSNEYTNANTKLEWMCERGHKWNATYKSVGEAGSWCPKCVKRAPSEYTILDCKDIAISRNGECLSSEYINCKTKIVWKCKDGHTWGASLTRTIQGSWCPKCAHKLLIEKNKEKYTREHPLEPETKKFCTKCGELKDLCEFTTNREGRKGVQPQCKECMKKARKSKRGA